MNKSIYIYGASGHGLVGTMKTIDTQILRKNKK